jgi:DNA-binding GntR family transcriptional regulator
MKPAAGQPPVILRFCSPNASPNASLGDRVAAEIAEQIIFGAMPPGHRVTEDSIERWSGVSRSPIREAFRLLERDGLVRRETNRGITVTDMDADALDELYRMRVVLEAQAAALAAQRATPADIRLLEQRNQALKTAFKAGDPRQYFRANVGFTDAVHATARSERLRDILRIIGNQALRFRFLAYQRSNRFTAESLAGAAKVLRAIGAGDADAASSVTAALLQASWDEIRTLIAAPPQAKAPPRAS